MALQSTPQLRIVHALSESRRCRHHKHCRCGLFDHLYCNAADALWQNKLNRELEAMHPVPH
jgi:hypothetical protein